MNGSDRSKLLTSLDDFFTPHLEIAPDFLPPYLEIVPDFRSCEIFYPPLFIFLPPSYPLFSGFGAGETLRCLRNDFPANTYSYPLCWNRFRLHSCALSFLACKGVLSFCCCAGVLPLYLRVRVGGEGRLMCVRASFNT